MANNIKTSLYQAIKNNDIKAVEDALNMGANVDSRDFYWDQSTALIEACKNGNKDICRLLIDKGARIDLMDKYDNHPIHYACPEKNTEQKNYKSSNLLTLLKC